MVNRIQVTHVDSSSHIDFVRASAGAVWAWGKVTGKLFRAQGTSLVGDCWAVDVVLPEPSLEPARALVDAVQAEFARTFEEGFWSIDPADLRDGLVVVAEGRKRRIAGEGFTVSRQGDGWVLNLGTGATLPLEADPETGKIEGFHLAGAEAGPFVRVLPKLTDKYVRRSALQQLQEVMDVNPELDVFHDEPEETRGALIHAFQLHLEALIARDE